jgi:hypothetical protein
MRSFLAAVGFVDRVSNGKAAADLTQRSHFPATKSKCNAQIAAQRLPEEEYRSSFSPRGETLYEVVSLGTVGYLRSIGP